MYKCLKSAPILKIIFELPLPLFLQSHSVHKPGPGHQPDSWLLLSTAIYEVMWYILVD